MSILSDEKARLPFVFVIGFNKTGTTAIHLFFERNGWPSVHWDKGALARRMVENCLDDRPILDGYDQRFRVFSDMAVQTGRIRIEANQLFRVLERDYPGAFFLHNTRNIEDWLRSRSANFVTTHKATNIQLELRRLNSQEPEEAIAHWREQRNRFDAEVTRYFEKHPRFLTMDIDAPDVPSQVSSFLGYYFDPALWERVRTN